MDAGVLKIALSTLRVGRNVNAYDLVKKLDGMEEGIAWAKELKLLPCTMVCNKCQQLMVYSHGGVNGYGFFQCQHRIDGRKCGARVQYYCIWLCVQL